MSELLPCPFPMEQKPVIEKIGNCYEINCIEVRRGIYIKVVVRVREDIGDEKMLAEIWNHRHHPPEVQHSVERMTPKKPIRNGLFINGGKCHVCDEYVFEDENFCSVCGQKIEWSK